MSAAIPANRSRQAATLSIWREGLAVISMLALPTVFTSGTIAVVIMATVWRQRTHGLPIAPPNRAAIAAMAFGLYAVGTWISVALAWRWSARRGLVTDVFAFRRLTWLDAAIVVVGFLAAAYGAPPITRWAGMLIGARGHSYPVNLHQPFMLALLVFTAYLTAPIGEEIMFRGLVVAWLRRLRCPAVGIWLLGGVAFACIHLPIYGVAWSVTMFWLGGLLMAVRLWRRSLTPGWLIHLLFNMRGLVIFPLFGLVSSAIGG